MIVSVETVRAHFLREQDIAHIQRLTLQEKRYRTSDPNERADLTVALADNHTDQTDLRAAYAIANGYDPADLDRNGFHAGYHWIDVTPSVGEQAIAYATAEQIYRAGYAERIA
jgi:hypothetical protein